MPKHKRTATHTSAPVLPQRQKPVHFNACMVVLLSTLPPLMLLAWNNYLSAAAIKQTETSQLLASSTHSTSTSHLLNGLKQPNITLIPTAAHHTADLISLKALREASPLLRLVKSMTIQFDPAFSSKKSHAQLERMEQLIKQALQEILEEDAYFPLFTTEKSLTVSLLDQRDANPNSFAFYDIDTNHIHISYHANSELADYKSILRNELYSHQIVATNQRNGVVSSHPYRYSLPFINQDGTINEHEFKKYADAIAPGVARIHKLYEEVIVYKNAVASELMESLLQVISHYRPLRYYITQEILQQNVQFGKTKLHADGSFESINSRLNPIPYTGWQKAGEIFYAHLKNNTPRDNAIAFIVDVNAMLQSMRDPQSPYATLHPAKKEAELGSFICQLPPVIQRLLLPEFYSYMLHFFVTDRRLLAPLKQTTQLKANTLPMPAKANLFTRPEKISKENSPRLEHDSHGYAKKPQRGKSRGGR